MLLILILILILTIPTHLLFCRRVSLPSQSACDHPPTSCEPCLPCIPQWGPPSHRQRQPAYQPQRPANLQRPILQSLWWWPAFRPRVSARLLEGKGDLCHCFLSPYSTWNGLRVGETTRMKYTQTKWNVHGQRKKFALGAQRNLYSTDSRCKFFRVMMLVYLR